MLRRSNSGGAPDSGVPRRERAVPARALLLSIAALAIPIAATVAVPEWVERDGALLVWLPVLLPPFLLAYHRGWKGVSLGLAGGMAALALSQAEILVLDIGTPRWTSLFAVVLSLVVVALAAGWLAESLHRERDRAEVSAMTDALTGLPNRRHATLFLNDAWASMAGARALAVVVFDLDHFKRVNDQFGHPVGDQILSVFADLLAGRTRRQDLSARFGGEEFITVLRHASMEDAETFADDVRRALQATTLVSGPVTVSAGIAALEEGMGSPDVLIAAADRALYAAKENGRNRVWRADRALARPKPPFPAKLTPSPSSLSEVVALVVDDEADSLRTTAKLLERLGCEVLTASHAREALRILTSGAHVDVLITDIVMPEMSGFTLMDLASRGTPTLPVLYISGYPQEEVYWGGTPGSRKSFLAKPFEVGALSNRLRELLEFAPPVEVAEPPSPQDDSGSMPRVVGGADRPALQGRILIVDDVPSVVETLQRLFRRAGYRNPLGLTDPREAINLLKREVVDLVVLDLQMPDVDGFQVMAEIAELVSPEEYRPILVITGDNDPEIRRRALDAGAMDFLGKPFDRAEVEARARNLLQTRFLTERVARHRDQLEMTVLERTRELADTRTEILHRLARAGEYRDDVTGRHAERVGLVSSLIATELGRPPKEVDLIRRTAPLHDIGKIAVPDSVLRKPSRLTASEFEIMKSHTTVGGEILGGSDHRILRVAACIALSHHERWDGKGYPYGLVGDATPIEARIVAVADSFDTMAHSRPYKEPTPPQAVLEEVVRCRGTHYDPEVVDAFRKICGRVGAAQLVLMSDPLDPLRDTLESGTRRPTSSMEDLLRRA